MLAIFFGMALIGLAWQLNKAASAKIGLTAPGLSTKFTALPKAGAIIAAYSPPPWMSVSGGTRPSMAPIAGSSGLIVLVAGGVGAVLLHPALHHALRAVNFRSSSAFLNVVPPDLRIIGLQACGALLVVTALALCRYLLSPRIVRVDDNGIEVRAVLLGSPRALARLWRDERRGPSWQDRAASLQEGAGV